MASCFCIWFSLCFAAADAVHDPADKPRAPEGRHQIIAVHKGADGPRGLGGDFGGQFLAPRPVGAFIAGDDLLIHLLKGTSRVRELRHKALIDGMASLACLYLLTSAEEDDGRPALSPDERREVLERLLRLYALFFPDGDYGFYAQFPAQIHRELAKLDAVAGKPEEALTHLRACVRFGELFASCDPEAERTSLLFRGEADGGYVKTGPDYDYRQEIREWLADPLFDGLREKIQLETE